MYPTSPPTWTSDLPPIDSDAPFIPNDDGHGVYSDRKGHLLSPLNGFRLRDLPHNNPTPSVVPQGVKERCRETGSSFSPPNNLSSPDSLATSPYLSFLGEPWMTSPASVNTDTDDDSSLASSTSSLSPDTFDLDTPLVDISVEDEDDENFYLCPAASPGSESRYHPLEQYPLHLSPHSSHVDRFAPAVHLDDDDLSPLTFSPPSLAPLHLLSLSESEHKPTSALNIKKSATYNPPRYDYDSADDDLSMPPPCSPSLRRSATLPELEPNADPFGLHQSFSVEIPTSLAPSRDIDLDMRDLRLRSFPGCETDDDLIPVELASKSYISDPSAIVPTTSTGIRSLLLWDHDPNPDCSDISIPRSPSPENFYLDPTVLADCADEEMQKVYELRQRTAKNEKWERERCRELSALLRLKLDERGMLGGGGGGCGSHQSGARSLPCCSNSSFSPSPSGDSPTVHEPHPTITSSSSSLSPSPLSSSTQNSILISTSSGPSSTLPSIMQSERPKHKIKSMAQLVASMLFNRQSDVSRQHLSKKPRLEATTSCHSSHYYLHPSSMGGAAMKVLPTPRSRLSKVILPEELEMDSEKEGLELEREVESGHEDQQEDEDLDVDVHGRLLSRSCMDRDLDERGCGNCSSHGDYCGSDVYHMSTQ